MIEIDVVAFGEDVEVMRSKYMVRMNVGGVVFKTQRFREREKAEAVKERCLETLKTLIPGDELEDM
jgi:hypothetical protein